MGRTTGEERDHVRSIFCAPRSSIEALYDQYGGLAFALAYRILGERGIAEDVVQEAFLTVWRQQATYDAARGSARTWIMTIVHHRAIDQLRGARAKYRADTAIKDAMPLPAKEDTWATVAQQLEREWVRGALADVAARAAASGGDGVLRWPDARGDRGSGSASRSARSRAGCVSRWRSCATSCVWRRRWATKWNSSPDVNRIHDREPPTADQSVGGSLSSV